MIIADPTYGPRASRALGPFFLSESNMSQNFVEIAGVGECVQAVDAAEMSEGALIASAAEWKEAGLLLTSDGLARLLNISKRTLMRLRSVGKLPRPVQLGRLVRWRTA